MLCSSIFFPFKVSFSSISVNYVLKKGLGFPGGAVVGSLPASAGGAGSSPGLGGSRVPRSGWAREPRLLSLRVWGLCPAAGGAAVGRGPRAAMGSGPRTAMGSGPRLPQLEKALARTEDPIQTKIINKQTNK